MKTDLVTIQSMFKTNEELFKRTIDDVPDDKWLTQMDDASNHLLWIVGHMLVTRANVPRIMGEQWSAPWEKLFVRGAKRVSPDEYPSPVEMRNAWDELSETLSKAFATAKPEALASPAKPGAPTLDGTLAGTVGFLCLHETYHLGQLGYLHKWLGCGQAIG